MKILILGHNGLLGNMVYSYFNLNDYEVITTDLRWPSDEFKKFILSQDADYIINCIGIIPQRKPKEELYDIINYELPIWLDSIGIRVIHPDTDEPSDTAYGLSKEKARDNLKHNTKIIKTSIMGTEKGTKFSLLEWFLNNNESVNGYINQYWNGNTTLEWSKWCEKIIKDWNSFNNITILSNPDCLSKYEILKIIKKVFNKDITIVPYEAIDYKYNCLNGDYITKDFEEQLKELKQFNEFF